MHFRLLQRADMSIKSHTDGTREVVAFERLHVLNVERLDVQVVQTHQRQGVLQLEAYTFEDTYLLYSLEIHHILLLYNVQYA